MDFSPSARISRTGAVAAGTAGGVCACAEIAKAAASKNMMEALRTRMQLVYRKNCWVAGDCGVRGAACCAPTVTHSTATDFARLRGWSTLQPRRTAML